MFIYMFKRHDCVRIFDVSCWVLMNVLREKKMWPKSKYQKFVICLPSATGRN